MINAEFRVIDRGEARRPEPQEFSLHLGERRIHDGEKVPVVLRGDVGRCRVDRSGARKRDREASEARVLVLVDAMRFRDDGSDLLSGDVRWVHAQKPQCFALIARSDAVRRERPRIEIAAERLLERVVHDQA